MRFSPPGSPFTRGLCFFHATPSELAFGKEVTISQVEKDRYGRTVAEVILPDGRSLGHKGFAWWFRRYAPADKELERLEASARTARVGLWSQPNPIPPWSWRKGDGVPRTTEVIGNRRSHVYHRPSCPGAGRMSAHNRVTYSSAAEAEEVGYRRAGDCGR